MKKDAKSPMAVFGKTLRDLPPTQIGKMVADHGMNKAAMSDKMASIRECKGKK